MTERKKVLITGSTGEIGRTLLEDLGDRYELTGTSRSERDDPRIVKVDFSDLNHAVEVFQGNDVVVHLHGKANHDTPEFEPYLQSNIIDLYTAFEATRLADVKRFVFASSNHAGGWWELAGKAAGPWSDFRPDGFYGAAKIYGEALGYFYSDRYGMEVICLRIGSYKYRAKPTVWEGRRILSTWLSDRDLSQLMRRSIDVPGIQFGIYYGVSNNSRSYWDVTSTVADLGYIPKDNAEDYAAEVIAKGGTSSLWGVEIPGILEED